MSLGEDCCGVVCLPLLRENGFLPDLDSTPADVARLAKMIW